MTIKDALTVFCLADRFRKERKTYAGVCVLPSHVHGPSPNPNQFKISVRDGVSVFHCFGDCNRGGDVIEFVKQMMGLDHSHVRFWFAEHFGDRLSLRKGRGATQQEPEQEKVADSSAKPKPIKSEREISVEGDHLEYKPIRFRLQVDPTASYLRERGLIDETIDRFGLGLAKRGMLAGQIAIPIWEFPKKEFSFGYLGRWAGEDFDEVAGRPRYKWPGGSPKQRFLFGFNEALEYPDDLPMIFVEGIFGARHCVQNGFPSSVAGFGSSLSQEQAKLLVESGRRIVLMFDGGEPG